MDFPQYRRRFDNKSFYKFINARTIEEVQLIGDKAFIHTLEATQYFEIIRLQEILNCEEGHYFLSDAEEYERMRK